jgi:hypothetical protein
VLEPPLAAPPTTRQREISLVDDLDAGEVYEERVPVQLAEGIDAAPKRPRASLVFADTAGRKWRRDPAGHLGPWPGPPTSVSLTK